MTGRDFLRVAKVSKTVEWVVRKCKALLFDAVHERIDEFINQNGRQVNLHRIKKKNRVRIHGIHGDLVIEYCVMVTPKYVYFVRLENIFDKHPDIQRVRSDSGVVHVHPYIGNVVEVMQHWCVKHHFQRIAH